MLGARGLQVAAIREDGAAGREGKAAARDRNGRRRTVQPLRRERLPFLEALHDLMSSGLSAGESVRLLSQRIKEPALRTLCVGLWERLSEGAPLSRAIHLQVLQLPLPLLWQHPPENLLHSSF
jgi:type II secretory pathway component PulF